MIKSITVLTGGQYTYKVGMSHENTKIGKIVAEGDNKYVLYDEDDVIISTVISNSVEVKYE